MTADQPEPAPGSPEGSPVLADGAPQSVVPARPGLTSGTVVVALFCVPVAVVLTVLAVQAAHGHQWAAVARFAWGAVGFLGIPGLVVIWLGRSLARRKRREPPPGIS